MITYIRAQTQAWSWGIGLFIVSNDGNKPVRVKEIVMEAVDPDAHISCEPSFTIEKNVAQVLMDDLWNCGVRPTDGAGTAGSMRATEKHLDDMRKIAFHKLEIK